MAPLDLLERQARDAVKNQVRTAQSQVRRETSIVRLAQSCLDSRAGQRGQKQGDSRPEPQPGVYVQNTLDGYLRRSPVQEIRTAPGYRAALIKRGVAAVAAVIVIAAVAAVLFRVL